MGGEKISGSHGFTGERVTTNQLRPTHDCEFDFFFCLKEFFLFGWDP